MQDNTVNVSAHVIVTVKNSSDRFGVQYSGANDMIAKGSSPVKEQPERIQGTVGKSFRDI